MRIGRRDVLYRIRVLGDSMCILDCGSGRTICTLGIVNFVGDDLISSVSWGVTQ